LAAVCVAERKSMSVPEILIKTLVKCFLVYRIKADEPTVATGAQRNTYHILYLNFMLTYCYF
jgi:hypothetical protein